MNQEHLILVQTLKNIVEKTARSATSYSDQIQEAEHINNEYENYVRDEKQLNEEIRKNLSFKQSYIQLISNLNSFYQESYSLLQQEKEKLKEAILLDAKIKYHKGEEPLIFQVDNINGITPFLKHAYQESKIIQLKTIIQEKQDLLHKLESQVYCFDEGDFNAFDKNSIPQDPSLCSIFSQKLISSMGNSCNLPKQMAHRTLNQTISNCVQERTSFQDIAFPILKFSKTNNLGNFLKFNQKADQAARQYLQAFEDQKSHMESIRTQFSKTLSEYFSLINSLKEHVSEFTESMQSQLDSLGIKSSILCFTLIFSAQDHILSAQNVISALDKAIYSNKNIPTQIWTNQVKIQNLISDLSSSLNELYQTITRLSVIPHASQLYPSPSKPINLSVDEISHSQIVRAKNIAKELSNLISNQNQSINLDVLKHQMKAFTEFWKSSETLPEINIPSPIPQFNPETQNEFLELKSQIIKAQQQQLLELTQLLESLPDAQEHGFPPPLDVSKSVDNIPDTISKFQPEKIEIKKENSLRAMPEYSESTNTLLERISNRRNIVELPPAAIDLRPKVEKDCSPQDAVNKLVNSISSLNHKISNNLTSDITESSENKKIISTEENQMFKELFEMLESKKEEKKKYMKHEAQLNFHISNEQSMLLKAEKDYNEAKLKMDEMNELYQKLKKVKLEKQNIQEEYEKQINELRKKNKKKMHLNDDISSEN